MVGEVASLRALAVCQQRGEKRPNAPLLAAQTQQRDHEGADAPAVGVVQVALAQHVLEDHHQRPQVRIAAQLTNHVAGGQQRRVLVEAQVHVDASDLRIKENGGVYAVLELDDGNARMTDDDDVGGKRTFAEHLWFHSLQTQTFSTTRK